MPRYRALYMQPGQRMRVFHGSSEKIVEVDQNGTVFLTESEAAQLRAYDLEPVIEIPRGRPKPPGGFE